MNNQFGQEPGRFIDTFDRELRNQIADYERRVAFEQDSGLEIKLLEVCVSSDENNGR